MDASRAFLTELRRRKVLRTLAIYAGAAWVAIQAAGLALPGLGLSGAAIRYVWIGAFGGLPLALLFAWRYQITSRGIVRTAPAETAGSRGRADGAGAKPGGEGPEAGAEGTVPLGRRDHAVLGTMAVVAAVGGLYLAAEMRALPAVGPPGPGEIPPNSIAVLPLENVTGDPDQAHFVAGIHEALITDLGKIGALVVKAASSSRVYANVVQPVQQTGRDLGSAHLVEGSVFRTGDRMRLNVRLVAVASGESLWSDSFERDVEDVLTLQSEVARAVADRVGVELAPDEERRLAATRKVNPEVYETYLRGMFHLNQYTPEGVKRGLAYLQRAVEMDPDDPLAYAGLAQGYSLIGHAANPPPGAFPRAREAAARALELDPLFPRAHAAMAEIRLYHDWDWEGAERSFRRALQLNPNLEFAHAHYAWYRQLVGDLEGAIEHMERARQIAPVTPIFPAWLGWLYWADGRLEEAAAEARASLEVNPRFPWGLFVLGGVHATAGRHQEAIATHERLLEVQPNVGRWGLGFDYALTGRHEEALKMLAELAEAPGQKDVLLLGLIHAVLGERDEAFRWLEAAREARVDWFPFVAAGDGYDPFVGAALDTLREDPRYQRLVAPLGIPRLP